jgi:DNA-binding transcriptional regulator YiaG
MNPKTIGEHLKKSRLELGWGQQQVADARGYTWLSVSNWERGVCRPSKQAMLSIIAFLGDDPRAEEREINT